MSKFCGMLLAYLDSEPQTAPQTPAGHGLTGPGTTSADACSQVSGTASTESCSMQCLSDGQ